MDHGSRTCLNCKARQCTDCSFWFGDQNVEKDHRDRTCATMRLIQTDGVEAATLALLSSVSKPCPNPKCHVPTQKRDGCDHMKCTTCGAHWCWECGWLWDKNRQGYGVYEHMRDKHNWQ